MLYIADFSGHGVSAALNTVRLHSFVHGKLQGTDDPARLLRKLNKRLHAVLPAGQFATMFCAKIDFHTQTLEYASAGGTPKLFRKSSDDAFEVISQPSLPLGIVSDVAYESQTVAFCPGGGLVLYSDGLIETPKPPGSLCTTDSVREHLNKTNQAITSLELCQSLLGEYSRPEIKANDDITIVIAKHTGGAMEPVKTYEI
jgi:sigma-B regulation protein RsbU (phosphoserine phosphatase)